MELQEVERSENNIDKMAAYTTLYSVLLDLTKVLSPITPFISENIYQNLVYKVNSKDNPESIHLCDFPVYDKNLIDDKLVHDIDTIITIVSLGRSARSRANIKNRQPLQKLFIYTSTEKNIVLDEVSKKEILEELNMKELKVVSNTNNIISYQIKPNFVSLKDRFGDKMKDVISQLSKIDDNKKIELINNDEKLIISIDSNHEMFSKNDFLIEEISNHGISASSSNGIIVGVETHISSTLLKEGIVRDLIRQIQNFRKESGLEVQDRIALHVDSDDEIMDAIKENKNYFMNEILGVSIEFGVVNSPYKYNKEIKLDSKIIKIGILVSN